MSNQLKNIINLTPNLTMSNMVNSSSMNFKQQFTPILSHRDIALQSTICLIAPLNQVGREQVKQCMSQLQRDILSNPSTIKCNIKK